MKGEISLSDYYEHCTHTVSTLKHFKTKGVLLGLCLQNRNKLNHLQFVKTTHPLVPRNGDLPLPQLPPLNPHFLDGKNLTIDSDLLNDQFLVFTHARFMETGCWCLISNSGS